MLLFLTSFIFPLIHTIILHMVYKKLVNNMCITIADIDLDFNPSSFSEANRSTAFVKRE